MDPEKTLTFCLGLKAEEVTQFSVDPSILQHGNTLCVVVIVVVDKQLPQQRWHLRSILSYGSYFSGVASFFFSFKFFFAPLQHGHAFVGALVQHSGANIQHSDLTWYREHLHKVTAQSS